MPTATPSRLDSDVLDAASHGYRELGRFSADDSVRSEVLTGFEVQVSALLAGGIETERLSADLREPLVEPVGQLLEAPVGEPCG